MSYTLIISRRYCQVCCKLLRPNYPLALFDTCLNTVVCSKSRFLWCTTSPSLISSIVLFLLRPSVPRRLSAHTSEKERCLRSALSARLKAGCLAQSPQFWLKNSPDWTGSSCGRGDSWESLCRLCLCLGFRFDCSPHVGPRFWCMTKSQDGMNLSTL